MSRPQSGAAPRRGEFYELALEGARSDRVVILSENDWNDYTRDCVVVPFIRDAEARASVVRPRLDDELIADCTVVTSIAQEDLGRRLGDCPADVLAATATGVRTYFGIDDTLNPPRIRRPTGGRSGWWPRQAEVHMATRIAPEAKWVTIVSEHESNVVLNNAVAARLTSVGPKRGRTRWEVPVRGGYVICTDLHAIPYSSFEQRPRISPPLSQLNRAERQELAKRLAETLEL